MELLTILPAFVSFLSLWQNSWENQLKEERFYFCSWFQRPQSVLIGSVVSGPVWSKAAHLVAAGKQKESHRREHGPTVSLKVVSPVTWLSYIRCHLLKGLPVAPQLVTKPWHRAFGGHGKPNHNKPQSSFWGFCFILDAVVISYLPLSPLDSSSGLFQRDYRFIFYIPSVRADAVGCDAKGDWARAQEKRK